MRTPRLSVRAWPGGRFTQSALIREADLQDRDRGGMCVTLALRWIIGCYRDGPRSAHLFTNEQVSLATLLALQNAYLDGRRPDDEVAPRLTSVLNRISGGEDLEFHAEYGFQHNLDSLRNAFKQAVDEMEGEPEWLIGAIRIVHTTSTAGSTGVAGHLIGFCLSNNGGFLLDANNGVLPYHGDVDSAGFASILQDVLLDYPYPYATECGQVLSSRARPKDGSAAPKRRKRDILKGCVMQ